MKLFAILLAATASSAYAAVTPPLAGNVYIDAGSSGSTISAYSDADNEVEIPAKKCLSECKVGASSLKGNSIFGVVGTAECTRVATSVKDAAAIPDADQPQTSVAYGKFLALEAFKQNPTASNKGAIPALATAGNRIISRAQNDLIWGKSGGPVGVCGQAAEGHTDYKIATLVSGKCGTIPGTREAVFEATAFHAAHKDQLYYKADRRLIFTSGGASAQISIPIYTEEDEKIFKSAVAAVTLKFAAAGCELSAGECADIKTPGNKPLPYFTTDKGGSPTVTHPEKNAAADFIRFWTLPEIKLIIYKDTGDVADADKPRNKPFKLMTGGLGFRGLGTISFIGLAGKGGTHYKGVAGGVNQIEEWAKIHHCATGTWDKDSNAWTTPVSKWTAAKFDNCLKKFREALAEDLMWTTASGLMTTMSLRSYKISYGTASIQPFGLVMDQASPDGLATSPREMASIQASPKLKKLHAHIANDNKLFGIGKGGAKINKGVDIVLMQKGQKAIMEVTKDVCIKVGRGFGYGWSNTCVKAFWVHELLGLALSTQNLADFADADVAKGEIFSFKAKHNLRKREQQQATLQTDADTNAKMFALGKQLLKTFSDNPLNYLGGVAYAV